MGAMYWDNPQFDGSALQFVQLKLEIKKNKKKSLTDPITAFKITNLVDELRPAINIAVHI